MSSDALAYDPGLDIRLAREGLGLRFGPGVAHPDPEVRTLDAIRASLLDPDAEGPAEVYSISMDVGDAEDLPALQEQGLLFGAVVYAAGLIGREPVRSQGHVHASSLASSMSTPELYEVWNGKAAIVMQERALDDPGRCFAVVAGPGDKVLVPPGWAHYSASLDASDVMAFGAWCVRDYGFEYDDVRARRGLAWYPVAAGSGELEWLANSHYSPSHLEVKSARHYREFGIDDRPIYDQWRRDPARFDFIARPDLTPDAWVGFTP